MATAQRRRPAPVPEVDDPPQRQLRSGNARARAQSTRTEQATRTSHAVVTNYDYDEKQDEILEDVEFAPGQEPAFVRVGAGKTLNLGDFNSLRVDVSVTIPCLRSGLNDAIEAASSFVSEKLMDEEIKWLGSTNTKRKADRRN